MSKICYVTSEGHSFIEENQLRTLQKIAQAAQSDTAGL